MKPFSVKERAEEGTLPENAYKMGMDEESSTFMMDALGKLYTYPARAVLREYLSNALDSHKETNTAGLPPIEVTLPYKNSPTLKIRDYGTGITEEQFRKVISRYGASTKRNSNKYTGGFGLGLKSAYAVTPEFYLTSYVNGTALEAKVYKNSKGEGLLQILNSTPTTEPNGVLAVIPIPQSNVTEISFTELSKSGFFKGINPEEVKIFAEGTEESINGITVHNPTTYTSLKLGNTIVGWISNNRGTPKYDLQVLVGEVRYALESSTNSTRSVNRRAEYGSEYHPLFTRLLKYHRDVVLNIPVGSVDLPASREHLSYTERTLETLNALASNLEPLVEDHINSATNQQTRNEALNYVEEEKKLGYWGNLTWRGQKIPKKEDITTSDISIISRTDAARNSVQKYTIRNCNSIQDLFTFGNLGGAKYQIEADEQSYSDVVAEVEKLIRDYFNAIAYKQGVVRNVRVAVLNRDSENYPWLKTEDPALTVEQMRQTIKEHKVHLKNVIKVPKEQTPSASSTAAYPVVDLSKEFTPRWGLYSIPLQKEEDFKDHKELYYFSKKEISEAKLLELNNLFPKTSKHKPGYADLSVEDGYSLELMRQMLGSGSKIVFLPKTKKAETFQAAHPQSKNLLPVLREKFEERWGAFQTSFDDEIIKKLLQSAIRNSRLLSLKDFVATLTDPEIKNLPQDLQVVLKVYSDRSHPKAGRYKLFFSEVAGKEKVEEICSWSQKVDDLANRYPLLLLTRPAVGVDWETLKEQYLNYIQYVNSKS